MSRGVDVEDGSNSAHRSRTSQHRRRRRYVRFAGREAPVALASALPAETEGMVHDGPAIVGLTQAGIIRQA